MSVTYMFEKKVVDIEKHLRVVPSESEKRYSDRGRET